MKRSLHCLLALSLVFLIMGCSTEMPMGSVSDTLNAEQRFTLKTVDGSSLSLDQEIPKHKVILLNFFATWCPPCQEEIPDLIGLQSEHAQKGFAVIGVDVEESRAKVEAFVKRFGINYPVTLDESGSIASAYGLVGVPTTFLIDTNGKIIGEYHAFTRKLVADIESALK